jgi:hypothetical protein
MTTFSFDDDFKQDPIVFPATLKSATYTKHHWAANGDKPERDDIELVVTWLTEKNGKELTSQHLTGLEWGKGFEVSEDGKKLNRTGTSKLRDKSDHHYFFSRLINSGLPKSQANEAIGNLTKLEGLKFYVERAKNPNTKNEFERIYPVTLITSGASTETASPNPSPASNAAPSVASSRPALSIDPATTAALNEVFEVLAATNGNKVTKNEFFKAAGAKGLGATAVQIAYNPEGFRAIGTGLGFTVNAPGTEATKG